MQAEWLNPDNIHIHPRFGDIEKWGWGPWTYYKRFYEVTLVEPNLTFRTEDGVFLQPDRHELRTDFGSTPPPLRGRFPHDEFPRSYYLHDSGCRFGGFWLSHMGEDFMFHRMDLLQVNEAFRQGMLAEARQENRGDVSRRVDVIYRAVRCFSGEIWNRYRKATAPETL